MQIISAHCAALGYNSPLYQSDALVKTSNHFIYICTDLRLQQFVPLLLGGDGQHQRDLRLLLARHAGLLHGEGKATPLLGPSEGAGLNIGTCLCSPAVWPN